MSGQPYAGDIIEPYCGGDATDCDPIIVSWLSPTQPVPPVPECTSQAADLNDATRYFQRRIPGDAG